PIDWSRGPSEIARVVIEELTTPPLRFAGDPIILKEELQDHVLMRDVPFELAAAIESNPARFPGVRVRAAAVRSYPAGDVAAHVIGVRRPDPQRPATDPVESRVGESGVERARDRQLKGEAGIVRHWKDRRGELLRSERA